MAELAVERRFAAHREAAAVHGLVGGLVAGVVMWLVLGILFAVRGDGFFHELNLFGSVWYGALMTTAAAKVYGIITLAVLSALIGIAFSYAIVYIHVEPIVTGLVFGVVVWFFLYGVRGAIGTFFTTEFLGWVLLVAAAFYGVVIGLFEDYADRRRLSRMEH